MSEHFPKTGYYLYCMLSSIQRAKFSYYRIFKVEERSSNPTINTALPNPLLNHVSKHYIHTLTLPGLVILPLP